LVELSVVIVNWRTRELLQACLRSLREALGERIAAGTAEVIVVENASGDGSAEMVAEEFPEVRLFANAENRGYAAANNQGIAAAHGRNVMLLNPDTEVPREAVERLEAFLEAQPRCGAAAPMLVHPDGQPQLSLRGFPTPLALLGAVTGLTRIAPAGSPLAGYQPRALPSKPAPVEQPMTSCLLLRGEALRAVGGFDETFPIFFNDVDLCWRLREAGWEIWFVPEARVVHHGGASTRQVRLAMLWESHRGLHRFYRKHYRRRLPAPLYALVVAAIYAGALARSIPLWLRQTMRPRNRQ
jgi:N-acetylglucosaminyl-diphospho-decaprenol L-rhamnosyltransferase